MYQGLRDHCFKEMLIKNTKYLLDSLSLTTLVSTTEKHHHTWKYRDLFKMSLHEYFVRPEQRFNREERFVYLKDELRSVI